MEILPAQVITTENGIDGLISQALDKNVPVESLERLLAMRRELKAEYAKEQFILSMSHFQAECPIIINTKKGSRTKTGIVAFYYAPLESIISQVRSLLAKHNLSHGLTTATDLKGDTVTAYCTARHIAGYSETTEFTAIIGEGTPLMTKRQVVAGAHTFARRYAFCNCFGIVTSDYDLDDGGNIVSITDTQIAELKLYCSQVKNAVEWIQRRYDVKELSELNTEEATLAIEALKKQVQNYAHSQV